MAERKVIWSPTAKRAKSETLRYWTIRNKSNTYSKRLNKVFRENTVMLAKGTVRAKPTEFAEIFELVVENFSIFYEEMENSIVILMLWDDRRDRDDLGNYLLSE